jgi:hypothetical protein
MANITPELFDLMEKVASTDPETAFQLVITTEPNTPVETLRKAGLRVEHEIPIISAVSGTATFEAVKRLANLEEVKLLEHDNGAVRTQ